jgi:hypothetical protein
VLGQPDPGENVPRVATVNREDRFDISPGVAFEITQRQALELGASYLDVTYDEQRPGDQDFENISLFANYRFKTSEMATLALLTTFEQYDPIVDDATDYYSLRAVDQELVADCPGVRAGRRQLRGFEPGAGGTAPARARVSRVEWVPSGPIR